MGEPFFWLVLVGLTPPPAGRATGPRQRRSGSDQSTGDAGGRQLGVRPDDHTDAGGPDQRGDQERYRSSA